MFSTQRHNATCCLSVNLSRLARRKEPVARFRETGNRSKRGEERREVDFRLRYFAKESTVEERKTRGLRRLKTCEVEVRHFEKIVDSEKAPQHDARCCSSVVPLCYPGRKRNTRRTRNARRKQSTKTMDDSLRYAIQWFRLRRLVVGYKAGEVARSRLRFSLEFRVGVYFFFSSITLSVARDGVLEN